jgi:hypothetical protein
MSDVYGERSGTGNSLWDYVISKHKNIMMVVCGHECIVKDPGSMNYRADVGQYGNVVHQVMANSQDIDADRGGVGLLLMMRFRDGGKTVDFNYFSPVNDNLAYKRQNQFSITLSEDQESLNADAKAAREVIDVIDALPERITLDTEADIVAARDAYEALTDAQKSFVINLKVLNNAEKALEQLKVESYVYGDVNDDGVVDSMDALMALQGAVGKTNFTNKQYIVADVDASQTLDAADALYILQKAVNKIQQFPVETD